MLAQILSWIIPAVGLAAFWICIKHPWGWAVGIGQQMLYVYFAFVTHQWGFVFHGIAFTGVFVRNFIVDETHAKHKRAKKERKAAKKAAKHILKTLDVPKELVGI